LAKLRRKSAKEKPQLVRFGHREIETLGLTQGFWTDLYHRAMTVYWPVFFGSAAVLFVTLNAVFGFLYWLGHEPIANAEGNGPLAYFAPFTRSLLLLGFGTMDPVPLRLPW
jgi:inward rectifier potassium channel